MSELSAVFLLFTDWDGDIQQVNVDDLAEDLDPQIRLNQVEAPVLEIFVQPGHMAECTGSFQRHCQRQLVLLVDR